MKQAVILKTRDQIKSGPIKLENIMDLNFVANNMLVFDGSENL